MTQLSRRRVLIAGLAGAGLLAAGAVGVEEGVLPGRSRLYAGLGLNGTGTTPPQATPGPQVNGQFNSHHRGVRVGWTIAYPPTSRVGNPLPVVVGLHGRYDDHTALFGDRIGLDRFLAANPQPIAIAAVDGGDTYWHPRASGEDAGAMVVDEFLPLLAEHGLQTARIGLYGYSMGGYGALRLAGVLGHDRVAAVAAISAALWKEAGDTAAGAFDDAADFTAHTVFGHQHDLRDIAVRVDCGRGDGFAPANRSYRAGFDDEPAGGLETGAHDDSYWRRLAPTQLAFLGQHLKT